MKNLVSLLFVVSACSASVDEGPSGGDDMPPDAGDGSNDPGEMIESATVRFLYTSVRDERGDTIDFTTGEPVHTHAGPNITIGDSACPDLYKYGYLLGASAPRFGREVTPNPLTWKVELKNTKSLDLAQSAFRVRGATDDWHPLPALAGDLSTITLTRDAFPALGERAGEYSLDIRTVGTDGTETLTSACFRMNPLTAPLEVEQASAAPLASYTFPDGPVSSLFSGSRVQVFAQRIVHHTAEPVTLSIAVPTPSATFTRKAVDDFVNEGTLASGVTCATEFDGYENPDPICTQTVPADPVDPAIASGTLTSGTWRLQVLTSPTGGESPYCVVTGLAAQCNLPARATTGAAITLFAVMTLSDLTDLAPSTSGPYGEHTIRMLTYSGRPVEHAYRCAEFHTIEKNGFAVTSCRYAIQYTRIHALDRASITFAAVPFSLATSSSATGTPSPMPHVPAALTTIAPFTHDTGDDDLPGPQ